MPADQAFVASESGAVEGGHPTGIATTSETNGMELCLLYVRSDELAFADNSLSTVNTSGQSLLGLQAQSASTGDTHQVRSDIPFMNI